MVGIFPPESLNLNFNYSEKIGTSKSAVDFVSVEIPQLLSTRKLYAYIYATTATKYVIAEILFFWNNGVVATLPLEVGIPGAAATFGRSFVSAVISYNSSNGTTPPADAVLLTIGSNILTGESTTNLLVPLNLTVQSDRIGVNIKDASGTISYRVFIACVSQ